MAGTNTVVARGAGPVSLAGVVDVALGGASRAAEAVTGALG
jgi:hypothetical protein